jgi:predicted dehydrogenase
MKKQIRVCMIGGGRVGKNHSRAFSYIPGGKIVAVVETVPQVREETAREFGVEHQFESLEAALAKIEFDAVVITTPTPTHLPLTALAAENSKHVFLEKPMALTIAECDAILDVVERNSVFLQLGFMRRFDPEFVAAFSALKPVRLASR